MNGGVSTLYNDVEANRNRGGARTCEQNIERSDHD